MRWHKLFSKLSSFSFVAMVMWTVLSLVDLVRMHYGFTRGLPKEWIENPKLLVDASIYGLIAFFGGFIIFLALEYATKPRIEI